MKVVDVIGSQPGRVLRVAAGGTLIAWGLRRGDTRGRAAAVVGVVPLTAGAADVCLLGPLVHGPLRGKAFREQRARRHETDQGAPPATVHRAEEIRPPRGLSHP